jgi:hypothetical protein
VARLPSRSSSCWSLALAVGAACLVAAMSSPAIGAPSLSISPEYRTADSVFGAGTVDAGQPSAAVLSGTSLVVWQEIDAIVGARVTALGAVLDPAGIAVAPSSGSTPDVAAGQGQYLAAWTLPTAVQAARVASDGTVLDVTPIPVRGAVVDHPGVGVSFGGTNYLVAWSEFHSLSQDDVYAVRVGSNGHVVGTPVALSTTGGDALHPDVAFDGTNFLVVWEELGTGVDVKGALVNQSGAVQSVFSVSTAGDDQVQPSVSWSGSEYLVAWGDRRPGTDGSDLYAARVSPAGVVLDTAGIAVSAATADQTEAAADFDGTNFLVTWTDARGGENDVYAAMVAPDGTVVDPAGIQVAVRDMLDPAPSAVWTGSSHLVFFGSGSATQWGDVLAKRLTQQLVGRPDVALPVVSLGANSQLAPAIAWDGSNQLVAWADRRQDPNGNLVFSVYAGRVSGTGQILDGSGVRVSKRYAEAALSVDVAFNGTNYLVVWIDPGGVFSRRMAPDGTLLDPAPVRLARADGQLLTATVASNGSNWVAAWFSNPVTGSNEVRAALVRPDGTVGSRTTVSTDVYALPGMDIGSDGTEYLVAWSSDAGGQTGIDLLGARLTAGGQLIDTTPFAISVANDPQTYPSVSNNSDPFLVTWEDYRNFSTQKYDVYGSRIGSDATVLDPAGIPIGAAPSPDTRPSSNWDGTNWLVAWLLTSSVQRIVCARVGPDGTVLDAPNTVGSSAHTGSVAATPSGPGHVTVAYGWLMPGPPDNAIRLFLRFVSE